eukprot:g18066.t1
MRCGSASSSFAALSYQLEEARTKQLKERSKRALELMKAAVEWKSWDELQTLSKAFQGYLEETEMIGNEQKNPPSREDSNGRKEALLVLSALADLKKKLQLCSAARDTSISTCDGTPALMEPASPGNAQAEDCRRGTIDSSCQASFFSAVAHGGTTFAPTLSTSSVSSSRSVPAGASELDRTLRLMSRSSGPVVSRTLRGALGPLHSEAQGSPASSTSYNSKELLSHLPLSPLCLCVLLCLLPELFRRGGRGMQEVKERPRKDGLMQHMWPPSSL